MMNLIEALTQVVPEFASAREFTPKEMREAFDLMGVKHNWKVLDLCEKVSHGVYRLVGDIKTLDFKPNGAAKRPIARKVAVVPDTTQPEFHQTTVDHSFEVAVSKNSTFASIPVEDPFFVPFGVYKDVERILKSRRFFPFSITGQSGNGKSSLVLQICAKHKIPLIKVNCTRQTDEEKLIGSKTLKEGNIIVTEGPLLVAMRSGCVILLEEYDACDANSILALQGIMEGKPYFFPLTGEYIMPAPGFNIVATSNTKGRGSEDGRYIGTQILNEAFLERWAITFEQEYPSQDIEKNMILQWMEREGCVDEAFAGELAMWSDSIRRTADQGAEMSDIITSRRLEHIVKAFVIFGDKKKAVMHCTGRYDALTKNSFRMLFDKIVSPDPAPEPTVRVKGSL